MSNALDIKAQALDRKASVVASADVTHRPTSLETCLSVPLDRRFLVRLWAFHVDEEGAQIEAAVEMTG